MSTSNNTDVGPLDRVVLPSSSFDLGPDNVTDVSSFRCILNEESPDLDNPGLYNCKTCAKGFVHRSRKLFQATSDVTALGNNEKHLSQDDCADSVGKLQNFEGLHLQTPQSSETSDTAQFITSPMLDLPGNTSNAELNEEQKQFPKNRFKKSKSKPAQENSAIFICNVCGRVFRWRPNIVVHLRIHETNIEAQENQAKFICHVCGKVCRSKGNIIDHLRIHEPNIEARYPFKCNKCVRQFTRKQNLSLHMMSHQKDETYNMLLHGNEYKLRNPYECKECCARFNNKLRLKQHMVNNHGAATEFICTQCKKYFIFDYRLKDHMNRVHKSIS